MSTIEISRRLLAASLLLLCACDSSPRPDPPREVYLDIRYSALGWSPDRGTWYFVKELREQRGYTWSGNWFDGFRWTPEVTATTSIVCAVGADGTGLREVYTIPDPPARVRWHYTAITPDERVVLAYRRDVFRLGPDGSQRIGKISQKIRWFEASASRSEIVAGDGETGLYLLDAADGKRRRLTDGRERHPRWSPDGRRLLFLRWNEDATAAFMLLDPDTGEARQVLREPLQRGLSHDDVAWDEPSIIRIGNGYVSDPWPLGDGLSVHPLGAPRACAASDDRALVSAPDCAAERPGLYGHSGRMGPPGIFGVDNVAGTVKLLAVEDFRPVVFDARWPRAVSEPARCRVRALFCLDGRRIEISSDEDWQRELGAHRNPEGQLW